MSEKGGSCFASVTLSGRTLINLILKLVYSPSLLLSPQQTFFFAKIINGIRLIINSSIPNKKKQKSKRTKAAGNLKQDLSFILLFVNLHLLFICQFCVNFLENVLRAAVGKCFPLHLKSNNH